MAMDASGGLHQHVEYTMNNAREAINALKQGGMSTSDALLMTTLGLLASINSNLVQLRHDLRAGKPED